MNYKYLIFDFNGTLYDDRKTCLLTINRMLEKRGMKELNFDEYTHIFTFPIIEYYRRAGLDLEKESFDDLAREWLRNYFSLEDETASLYDDALPTLNKLRKDHKIILLSATKQDILEVQLEKLGIKDLFDYIVGISDIYAASKIEEAKLFMALANIDPKEVLYIGDTLHDKEVSDELGTKIIFVENGHNPKDLLEKEAMTIPNLSKLCELI